VDAVIALLEADDTLKAAEWHKGEPARSRWNKYPFGWVEWLGGQVKPHTAVKSEHRPNLIIVLCDRDVAEDVAEDSVMDFAESIETLMRANPTIGGKVDMHWMSFDEKAKVFEEDRSIAGVRLTFTVIYTK